LWKYWQKNIQNILQSDGCELHFQDVTGIYIVSAGEKQKGRGDGTEDENEGGGGREREGEVFCLITMSFAENVSVVDE
jgi:hypothetical protein